MPTAMATIQTRSTFRTLSRPPTSLKLYCHQPNFFDRKHLGAVPSYWECFSTFCQQVEYQSFYFHFHLDFFFLQFHFLSSLFTFTFCQHVEFQSFYFRFHSLRFFLLLISQFHQHFSLSLSAGSISMFLFSLRFFLVQFHFLSAYLIFVILRQINIFTNICTV